MCACVFLCVLKSSQFYSVCVFYCIFVCLFIKTATFVVGSLKVFLSRCRGHLYINIFSVYFFFFVLSRYYFNLALHASPRCGAESAVPPPRSRVSYTLVPVAPTETLSWHPRGRWKCSWCIYYIHLYISYIPLLLLFRKRNPLPSLAWRHDNDVTHSVEGTLLFCTSPPPLPTLYPRIPPP